MDRIAAIVALALALAGCNSEAPQAAAPATPAPSAAAPAAKPALAGLLAGSLTQGVAEADREAALTAQVAALDSGQRRTWRGPKGAFGWVEPGAEGANCRDYTHTIYVAGRPRSGKGQACRDAATGWKFVS